MMKEVHKYTHIRLISQTAVYALFLCAGSVQALDLSYDPQENVEISAEQRYVATALTVYQKDSETDSSVLIPSEFDSERPGDGFLNQEAEPPAKEPSIRLDFRETKEKGWNFIPEIAFGESEVFKDGREAVQWADSNNQPKSEPAHLDRTLEKLGITHYKINIEAEYIF